MLLTVVLVVAALIIGFFIGKKSRIDSKISNLENNIKTHITNAAIAANTELKAVKEHITNETDMVKDNLSSGVNGIFKEVNTLNDSVRNHISSEVKSISNLIIVAKPKPNAIKPKVKENIKNTLGKKKSK